jgi:hypothetical protein
VAKSASIGSFSPPRVVDPPGTVTIKTRLRLSPRDAAVLDDLGQVVALARGKDLAERCRLGTSHIKEDFARRKRVLTKQGRLQILRGRRERVKRDFAAGHVHVTQGGKDRLRQRLHLEDSSAENQWRYDWVNARRRIEADGESGKKLGNQTIRVSPDGTVLIKLPPALAEKWRDACDERGRYQLTAAVTFHYRGTEWLRQVQEYRAVGYRISFEGDRCYIAASFTVPMRASVPLAPDRIYAIDHNVDHFAGWAVDRHDNPVGAPDRFPVDNSGPAARRDAQVRHAVSQIIGRAKTAGASAIAIKDLGFETQREELGWGGLRGRGFRRMVVGMPTAGFPARLAAMADRAGLAVVAVDPRYTSKWGIRYWQRPTCTTRHQTSRHEAAAIVIGRRALGLGARRRIEKSAPRQRTEAPGPSPDGRGEPSFCPRAAPASRSGTAVAIS